MGFIIIDLIDEKEVIAVNFWNWHPTVELVRMIGVIDTERIELMHQQCAGAVITEDEARAIARGLQREVLAGLQVGERVQLDLSITAKPDDGTLHRGANVEQNYSATREWLAQFAEFCSKCGGFRVL